MSLQAPEDDTEGLWSLDEGRGVIGLCSPSVGRGLGDILRPLMNARQESHYQAKTTRGTIIQDAYIHHSPLYS
jgi:hypothetical protein